MKYAFHPEAEEEFLDAVDYYEGREPGLGYDFAIEVRAAVENILNFPNAWTVLSDDIRQCQVRRFPYGIVYSRNREAILILAVMHLHRDPAYWKSRAL